MLVAIVFYIINWKVVLALQSEVEMLLPIVIGDYTDFFSSMHHARNCGLIFRGPVNPLPQNWYLLLIL
jgi:fumarylacetoacetase